jgi:hypothetical protein
MSSEKRNVVKDIIIRQCAQCNAWYAECRSRTFGRAIQWGKTEIEAAKRLREFIEKCWKEAWPTTEPYNEASYHYDDPMDV